MSENPLDLIPPMEEENPRLMKSGDPKVPEYVVKRGPEVEKRWISVFNQFYEIGGEAEAWLGANTWLKSHIVQMVTLAATVQTRERLSFTISTDGQLIKRTDSGEEYISAILADVDANRLGERHTPEVLKKWADQINANPIVGDLDHEEYDKILSAAMTDDEVRQMFKEKKGIAKTLKAIYKDGKLWIRAVIDKRYSQAIQNSKGLSLEAVVTKDVNSNTIIDGDILGFTFGVTQSPINSRAVVV